MNTFKTLIDEKDLQTRIKQLAEQIDKDYYNEEIQVLSVLKGASFFTIDLCKNMKNEMKIEFIELCSYGDETKSTGTVILKKDVIQNIKGKNILIVEDIVDTGNTLLFLLEHIKTKQPKSVKICTLLDKPNRRKVDVNIDYIGFKIPNKFVLGYGLDYKEYYRNLPYIAFLEE